MGALTELVLCLLLVIIGVSEVITAQTSSPQQAKKVAVPAVEDALRAATDATSEETFKASLDKADKLVKSIGDTAKDPIVLKYLAEMRLRIAKMRRIGFLETKRTDISARLFSDRAGL